MKLSKPDTDAMSTTGLTTREEVRLLDWLSHHHVISNRLYRDCADAMIVLMLLKRLYPRYVQTHFITKQNSIAGKLKNWRLINERVLFKLGMDQTDEQLERFANSERGAVERFLYMLMKLMSDESSLDSPRSERDAKSNAAITASSSQQTLKLISKRGKSETDLRSLSQFFCTESGSSLNLKDADERSAKSSYFSETNLCRSVRKSCDKFDALVASQASGHNLKATPTTTTVLTKTTVAAEASKTALFKSKSSTSVDTNKGKLNCGKSPNKCKITKFASKSVTKTAKPPKKPIADKSNNSHTTRPFIANTENWLSELDMQADSPDKIKDFERALKERFDFINMKLRNYKIDLAELTGDVANEPCPMPRSPMALKYFDMMEIVKMRTKLFEEKIKVNAAYIKLLRLRQEQQSMNT